MTTTKYRLKRIRTLKQIKTDERAFKRERRITMSNTQERLENAATVMEKTGQPPQPPRRRWFWVLVGLGLAIAIVTLIAALVLANVRNISLKEQLSNCKAQATKSAIEINEMARQCGNAARRSLEKLSEPEEEEAAANDQAEEDKPVGIDAGIDGSVPTKRERW